MSQKQTKSVKKHTVKEVLKSIEWSVEDGRLVLMSGITAEFVTIDMSAFNGNNREKTDVKTQ